MAANEGDAVTEPPRLMSGATAAAYCGVMPATWSKWVASGVMPKPVEFTRRWDRKAIDLALDKSSGIATPSVASQGDEFATWKASRETRKSATGIGVGK